MRRQLGFVPLTIRIVGPHAQIRAVRLIAQQTLHWFRQRTDLLASERKVLIFFLPQPTQAIGVYQRFARLVTVIGTAAVNSRPELDHRRAFGHYCLLDWRLIVISLIGGSVLSHHYLRSPVVLGKIIQGPQY